MQGASRQSQKSCVEVFSEIAEELTNSSSKKVRLQHLVHYVDILRDNIFIWVPKADKSARHHQNCCGPSELPNRLKVGEGFGQHILCEGGRFYFLEAKIDEIRPDRRYCPNGVLLFSSSQSKDEESPPAESVVAKSGISSQFRINT